MKEIKDIILAFTTARQQGLRAALATVVHVEGSSYRRPGARMLVTEDGMITGAISGGCLEGDALRKALYVMGQQKSMLVTYDTMDEDDAVMGVGLGCNGIIQVLLEPIDEANPNNPIEFLKSIVGQRQPAVLISLFSLKNKKEPQLGICLLKRADDLLQAGNIPAGLQDILIKDAATTLASQNSCFKNFVAADYDLTAFIEWVRPNISMVVFGAGNDVIPLAQMATILGWETTIVDGRPAYAKKERFASGCQILVAKPEQVLANISIHSQTVFLLMTHNYNYDKAMMRLLLQHNVVYIGMLGPKKKLSRMLDEFAEEGLQLTHEQLSAIHSPVGLDIGAETSDEIALSILAEIKAVFTGKLGQSLHGNNQAIHSRHTTIIEQVKLVSS